MSYVLDPSRQGPTIEDTWPCLFFGTEVLPVARRKMKSFPWARKVLSRMISEADEAIRAPPSLPFETPGWRHDFYSPGSAEHLVFSPLRGWSFVDPSDGTVYRSREKRAAWVLLEHERTYRAMRSIGLLYKVTGREQYARWVAEGLQKAAEFFEKMPRSDDRYGALYFQPLYDAQAIMLVAGAHEFIGDLPAYEGSRSEEVRTAIFEKGRRSLLAYHRGAEPHNITCYVSAALATVDLQLGEADQLELAISEDPRGLLGLLDHGLRADQTGSVDGFWFEGTTFYHFYAMPPLFRLHEFAGMVRPGRGNLALVRRKLITMAKASVALADGDLRLPWMGDLGSSSLLGLCGFSSIYEYAAGVLDPGLGVVLSACASRCGRPGVASLLYGPSRLAKRAVIARQSTHLRASGIGLLRSTGEHGEYYVLLRSGRHGAGHDHLDKLGIIIHAAGRRVMPDIGTPGYSLREFRSYCRSTFAHNCPMVDERNQSEVHSANLAGEASNKFTGRISDGYEGVEIERSVTLDPPEILIEDSFAARVSHRYAIVFHAAGQMESGSPVRPMNPRTGEAHWANSLAYFQAAGRLPPRRTRALRWDLGDGMFVDCDMVWDRPFECVIGSTPANPMTRSLGTLVARTEASETRATTTLTIRRDLI